MEEVLEEEENQDPELGAVLERAADFEAGLRLQAVSESNWGG